MISGSFRDSTENLTWKIIEKLNKNTNIIALKRISCSLKHISVVTVKNIKINCCFCLVPIIFLIQKAAIKIAIDSLMSSIVPNKWERKEWLTMNYIKCTSYNSYMNRWTLPFLLSFHTKNNIFIRFTEGESYNVEGESIEVIKAENL